MIRIPVVILTALAPLFLIPACKRANQPTPPQATTKAASTSSAPQPEIPPTSRAVEAASTQPPRLQSAKDEVILSLGDGDASAPFRCRLLDPASGDEVAAVRDGKLTQPIPAGTYHFAVKRYEHEGTEVLFPGIVEHRLGHPIRIALNSAIELATAPWAGKIFRWQAVRPTTPDQAVQWQSGHHPVMLLPPGDYQLAIRPTEFTSGRLLWPGVIHVGADQRVTAKLDSGVAPPPNLTELPAPYDWAVLPANAKGRTIPVQHARGSWSPLLVPPGSYCWAVHTIEFDSAPVVFPGTITVSAGELTTPDPPAVLRVAVAAGGPRPFRLRLADPASAKTVAETRHGGVLSPMIVPPGDYDLLCQPIEFKTIDVALAHKLHLPAGHPIDFKLDTGPRIAGPDHPSATTSPSNEAKSPPSR